MILIGYTDVPLIRNFYNAFGSSIPVIIMNHSDILILQRSVLYKTPPPVPCNTDVFGVCWTTPLAIVGAVVGLLVGVGTLVLVRYFRKKEMQSQEVEMELPTLEAVASPLQRSTIEPVTD